MIKKTHLLLSLGMLLAACGQVVSPSAPPSIEAELSSPVLEAQAVTGSRTVTGLIARHDTSSGPVLSIDRTIEKVTLPRSQGLTEYGTHWSGQLSAQNAEEYTFFLTALGSAQLYLDDQLIAELPDSGRLRTVSGKYVLRGVQDPSRLRVDYPHSGPRPGVIALEWKSAHTRRASIPTNAYSPVDAMLDCRRGSANDCLAQPELPTSVSGVSCIGACEYDFSITVQNKSDLLPLNVRINSTEFPEVNGTFVIYPLGSVDRHLRLACPTTGPAQGTVNVTRIEDGATQERSISISCGEIVGPTAVAASSTKN